MKRNNNKLIVWIFEFSILFFFCGIACFGQSTKLNPPLVNGGDILSARITSDGSTVIYVADQDVDGRPEFYSVPIEGGTATKLSNINSSWGFQGFDISPDGNWIVFLRDNGLFSLPVSGGSVIQLSSSSHYIVGQLQVIKISPNSDRVVYFTGSSSGGELYSVPIGGGSVTLLYSDPLYPVIDANNLYITPAPSPRIVFSVRNVQSGGAGYRARIYSISITGGGLIQHVADNGFGLDVVGVLNDGSRIIYVRGVGFFSEVLYSVSINGTISTVLSVVGGPNHGIFDVFITPDDSRIVYNAQQGVAGRIEVYSVTPTGTGLIKLNTPVTGTNDARAFAVSSDGSFVAYMGDHPGAPPNVIYKVDVAGGPITDVSQGQTVAQFSNNDINNIATGDQYIIYLGTDDRLYSAPVSGSGMISDISGPIVNNGNIGGSGGSFIFGQFEEEYAPKFTSDGSMVVFSGDIEVDDIIELFTSPIDGGGVIKLNGPMVNGGDMRLVGGTTSPKHAFYISSNDERVVYVADQDTDNVFELYSSAFCSASSGSFYTTGLNQIGSAPLAFAHAGDQDANTDNQAYILADNNNDIIAINNTEALFMAQLPGDYSVYAINYDDGGVDNLNTGVNISALTGGCFEVSTIPVPITIVPSGDGSVNVSVTH